MPRLRIGSFISTSLTRLRNILSYHLSYFRTLNQCISMIMSRFDRVNQKLNGDHYININVFHFLRMWLRMTLDRRDTFYAHTCNEVIILNADDDSAYYRPNSECYQQRTERISFHYHFSHESNEQIDESSGAGITARKAVKRQHQMFRWYWQASTEHIFKARLQCPSHYIRTSYCTLLQISIIWQFANITWVRFEVPAAMDKKIMVYWYTTPCSLIDRYQRFGGICCLHLQDSIKMKLAGFSKRWHLFTKEHDVISQNTVIVIPSKLRTVDV
jgi:hypothetical protein